MTILKPWPEHQNPSSPHRTASAPYNFVPLPEKIVPAISNVLEDLPDHDKYYPERFSGYFDVTLTTRSPLYIRGPMLSEDLQSQEQDPQVKTTPEFFHTGDKRKPVIPGSSLRGMLRALLEIVSYSKMQWVSEKQLFFRTVDKSAVGSYYNHRMVEELGSVQRSGYPTAPCYRTRVEGGFFHIREDGTCFIEECTVARVEVRDLLPLFGLTNNRELYQLDGWDLDARTERNPNQTPNWSYQHREIWANIDRAEKDYFFPKQFTTDRNNRRQMRHPDFYLRFRRACNLAATSEPGKRSGKLVLTGHMDSKHLAFLFVPLEGTATPIEVSNDPRELDPNKRLVDRFHDDDQLTQWQKKAFPTNRLPATRPQPNGRLRNGDPVFFLRDSNQNLIFFGRAQMFRLPYMHRPIDLVPPELRQAKDIDYAEAMFGFVCTRQQLAELQTNIPQGDKHRAYASRVIVTDGVLQSDPGDIWLAGDFDKQIMPKILATPKPTAFQHYLTQQRPDHKKELDHYDSEPPDGNKTVIRGHKLYWHQGLDTDQSLTPEQICAAISEEPTRARQADTRHTHFKPLKPGVKFSFRVHFENLSDRELGALSWTLHPHGKEGQRYCHHLGMGKPLGMGTVELHAHLHIIDRTLRYRTLFIGDNWQLGESAASENPPESTQPTPGISKVSTGEDLAVPDVLARLTRPFEEHLLYELNPDPPCTRLADMLRIAILLKLLEWPGYRAEEGPTYLTTQQPPRPNTRYMKIQPNNEYRDRPVLPDPTQFDAPYFRDKSRPQDPQAAVAEQAPAEKDISQPVLSHPQAELFTIGKDLRNLVCYADSKQGIEVRIWNLNPAQVIGFIPNELIDRKLGPKISGIVTGLRQEPNGRLVIGLKLKPKR